MGVLGQKNEEDALDTPVMISQFKNMGLKVKDVALGEYHTMAMTDDGNIWTWGYGGKQWIPNFIATKCGALGHGDRKHHFSPKKGEIF